MDAFRAEFPGFTARLARRHRPLLAHERLGWALLAAFGAGFLVQIVAELVVVSLYAFLFPAGQTPQFPARRLWEGAGELAAGAVAMRIGGVRAVVAYAAVQLVSVAAIMPAVSYSCLRNPNVLPPQPCDYAAVVAARWPLWLPFALGVLVHRVLAEKGSGSNVLLHAAGAISLGAIIATRLASVWTIFVVTQGFGPQTIGIDELPTYLIALGTSIGAVVGGVFLARSRLAAVVLLALALIGPSFALGFPQLFQQTGLAFEPLRFWLMRMSWLWTPLVAALALSIAWVLARRRVGTIT